MVSTSDEKGRKAHMKSTDDKHTRKKTERMTKVSRPGGKTL